MTELEKVLERVRSKCHIEDPHDPDSCWLWTARKTPDGYVKLNYKGGMRHVRRLLAHLLGRLPLTGGAMLAITRCGNRTCVAPHHIHLTSKAAHNRQVNRGKKYSILRRRKVALARRGHADAMTAEQVETLRSSTLPASHFARLYGKSKSAITAARRGETHRDYEPNPWQGLF